MAKNAFSELKSALKTGSLARCYIFHGEEAFLKEYYTRKLREMILSGPAGSFNYHKLDSKGLTVREVSDAVEAVPMMAEHTLVEVNDFDPYKAGDREQWVELFSDLPEHCTLLLVYDVLAWKPDRRIKKLTEAIEKNAVIVEFEKQDTRQLVEWTHRKLRSLGKEIDAATAEYLIFRTGSSMTTLSSELEKLAAYATGHTVTRQDIDTVTEPVLEAQVFSIVDTLTAGKGSEALRLLQDVLALQNEPIPVLAAMGSQLRRLYAAKVLQDAGKGPQALQSLYHLSSYPANQTMQAARRLSSAWCRQAVLLCEQTDYRLKTSYDDGARLLELLLLELLSAL